MYFYLLQVSLGQCVTAIARLLFELFLSQCCLGQYRPVCIQRKGIYEKVHNPDSYIYIHWRFYMNNLKWRGFCGSEWGFGRWLHSCKKWDKTEFLSYHIQNMHFLKPVNKQRNQSKKKNKKSNWLLKTSFWSATIPLWRKPWANRNKINKRNVLK